MKISCPNCQKKYNINQAKIPAGAKTAKCKACGHPMPLSEKTQADPPVIKEAAATESAAETSVIKRSCLYCGQNHTLRRDKIPPGTTSVKCKSCGRPLPLKLEKTSGTALVHSLKKEASEPATADKSPEAPPQPSPMPEILSLTCGNCQKR